MDSNGGPEIARPTLIVLRLTSFLFVIAFLFAGASIARAQTPAPPDSDGATPLPAPPPRKPIGQMDFGPLVITPTVSLMNVGVDSNIQNSQGSLESDLTMTVSPQVRAKYKAGRLSGEATTYLNYVFYKTYSDFGGFSPQLTVRLDYRFARRITFFTTDQFVSSKERPRLRQEGAGHPHYDSLGTVPSDRDPRPKPTPLTQPP